MRTLVVSAAEVTALLRALDTYLPQLRREAAATEQHELARALWDLEARLDAFRQRLLEGDDDRPSP